MGEPILLNIQTIIVMAKFDSSLIYKANGSVGNVTMYQLNGQNVVRERNFHPYDPKTPAQLRQRQKLKTSAWAYNWLKPILLVTQSLAGADRQLQNYWCQQFIPITSANPPSSLPYAAYDVMNTNYGLGEVGTIEKVLVTTDNVTAPIWIKWQRSIDFAYSANLRIRIFRFTLSGDNKTSQFNMSLSQFEGEYIRINNMDGGDWNYAVVIYDSVTGACSNVCMTQTPPSEKPLLSGLRVYDVVRDTYLIDTDFDPLVFSYQRAAHLKRYFQFTPSWDNQDFIVTYAGSIIYSDNTIDIDQTTLSATYRFVLKNNEQESTYSVKLITN